MQSGTSTFDGNTISHTHNVNSPSNTETQLFPITLTTGTVNKCFVVDGVFDSTYTSPSGEPYHPTVYGTLEILDSNKYPLSPPLTIAISKFLMSV